MIQFDAVREDCEHTNRKTDMHASLPWTFSIVGDQSSRNNQRGFEKHGACLARPCGMQQCNAFGLLNAQWLSPAHTLWATSSLSKLPHSKIIMESAALITGLSTTRTRNLKDRETQALKRLETHEKAQSACLPARSRTLTSAATAALATTGCDFGKKPVFRFASASPVTCVQTKPQP